METCAERPFDQKPVASACDGLASEIDQLLFTGKVLAIAILFCAILFATAMAGDKKCGATAREPTRAEGAGRRLLLR